MRNTVCLALATATTAAGMAFAMPASADPVTWSFPTGSYTQSCDVHWAGKNRSRIAGFCGGKAANDKYSIPYNFEIINCAPGSVGNNDGKLYCQNDENNGAWYYSMANQSALDAAAVIVTGEKGIKNDNIRWMKFGLTQPEWASAIKDQTLAFSDAALLLRRYMVQRATAQQVRDVVKAAYKQVYGKPYEGIWAYGDMEAAVKSGKSWYATLVYDFQKQKKATPAPAPTGSPPIG